MVKLVKPFALLVALLRGHFAAGAGLRKESLPDAEELPSSPEAGGADPPLPEGQRRLALENAGKGCWAHCGETAGDCGYCGSGQCCRAVDYRNQVPGCELAENAVGARCGAYKGEGFPALMNAGLPCIHWCGGQPGDCDYCGTGQCCRACDGELCVPGCELAYEDSWSGPGSQCGEWKDPSATRESCWYECETCAAPTRLLQGSSSKKGDADTPSTTDDEECPTYLCIYSEVAEDVEMTGVQQQCYGEEFPKLTAGHAAIMLVDTCTAPPTITTYGNWPDSVVDNGGGNDIRENYCGDEWTKEDYPFLFCHAISEEEEKKLKELVKVKTTWTNTNNCASFASETFEEVTGIDIDADEILGFETPREIGEHIIEANGGTNTPIPMPF